MRVWNFIVGGFLSRYGFQLEIGFWIKPYKRLAFLTKNILGYAFFGLTGNWFNVGQISLGWEWNGNQGHWCKQGFRLNKDERKREKEIRRILSNTIKDC